MPATSQRLLGEKGALEFSGRSQEGPGLWYEKPESASSFVIKKILRTVQIRKNSQLKRGEEAEGKFPSDSSSKVRQRVLVQDVNSLVSSRSAAGSNDRPR